MKDQQEKTFDEIYRLHYQTILEYCYYKVNGNLSLAEEFTHDVYMLLWSRWNDLRSHCEPVLLIWLKTTAKNTLSNYYRKKKQEPNLINYEEC